MLIVIKTFSLHRLNQRMIKGTGGSYRLAYETGDRFFLPHGLMFLKATQGMIKHIQEAVCSFNITCYLVNKMQLFVVYSECVYLMNSSTPNSWVVSSAASCSGGSWFKSWPGDQLSWLWFLMVYLFSSRHMPGLHLKLGHDHFPLHPLQFITPCHLTLYILDTESIVN